MKLSVLTYADYLPTSLVEGKIAVVIDVFRATSVITTALVHGAKAITVTADIETALVEYQKHDSQTHMLGGERGMHKIPGFDLGNSPSAYSKDVVSGKYLILTTTNGTNALHYCQKAQEIYIGSMLNCAHLVSVLIHKTNDIVIVCAGLSHTHAMEDTVCAGMLVSYLHKVDTVDIDDAACSALHMYTLYRKGKIAFLQETTGFKKLMVHGFEDDIDFCLQENIYAVAPRCINNQIVR